MVPGCSTGEEVYSLAMAMLEYIWLETQKTARPVPGSVPFQIFATESAKARLTALGRSLLGSRGCRNPSGAPAAIFRQARRGISN